LNLHSQQDMGLNATSVKANPSADISSSNVTWPLFGLPVGYTPSGYMQRGVCCRPVKQENKIKH
ncbi:hypothetical protein A2U01_0113962, partial [Trifolium medium]|nr:hypothetical protein [Trifolium medium]